MLPQRHRWRRGCGEQSGLLLHARASSAASVERRNFEDERMEAHPDAFRRVAIQRGGQGWRVAHSIVELLLQIPHLLLETRDLPLAGDAAARVRPLVSRGDDDRGRDVRPEEVAGAHDADGDLGALLLLLHHGGIQVTHQKRSSGVKTFPGSRPSVRWAARGGLKAKTPDVF